MAEGVGFEPTEPCGSPVFKTGAIDHSTTPPVHWFAGGVWAGLGGDSRKTHRQGEMIFSEATTPQVGDAKKPSTTGVKDFLRGPLLVEISSCGGGVG